MNSVFSFNKYQKILFLSFLAAVFCPKNLAFARKIMVLPESGGCPQPLWPYAYEQQQQQQQRFCVTVLIFQTFLQVRPRPQQ